MDKITDFFKELRERLSNPFLSSFLIAWLIYNWKIPLALIFYKSEDLSEDGYLSFIDLVNKTTDLCSIIWPIVIALGYTFVFPFFKNIVLIFNSWITAWGSREILKYGRNGKISIERYIKLRKVYEERTKLLDHTLTNENQYVQENAELKNKILEGGREKNDLMVALQKWIDYNSYMILNGEWVFTRNTRSNEQSHLELVLIIRDGMVSEILNESRDKKVIGQIENFHYNLNANEIIFYINSAHIKSSNFGSHFYVLRTQSGNNPVYYLTGEEDKKFEISFRKVD